MADDANEKTEQATDQRRDEFRKRGQVAQSKEIATFLVLVGVALTAWGMSKLFISEFQELFSMMFGNYIVASGVSGEFDSVGMFAIKKAAILVAPILFVTFVLSFFSSVMQVGFLYNEEALQFKLEKINPISGLKRVFSIRSLVEGLKAMAKVSIIVFIVYLIVKSEIQNISVLVEFSIGQLLGYFGTMALKLFGAVCLFMGALAVFDYGYQRWEMEKEMKMTKQEVKEENKNREGDPLIKARIKRVQREMANKRMMSEVPKADVIITNPTHIAVALKYEAGNPAPTLIAKGADLVAEKIKKIAKENKIPVIENKPLARAIYKTLNIGQWIPRELFKAVAEVLAYVYRLKKRKA